MFKVVSFFQKHILKCSIQTYINQQSLFPSRLLGSTQQNHGKKSQTFHQEYYPPPLQTQLQVVDSLIDILRKLEKMTLIKTKTVRKTVGFLHNAGIVVREFEVLNEQEVRIFDVEIQQGDFLEEFSIKIFDINSNSLLCFMRLESDLVAKSLVLKIFHAQNKVIGSVYETRGMSRITFVKNSENETVYQVFTHRGLSGFGWTYSAKILNPEGMKNWEIYKFPSSNCQTHSQLLSTFPKQKKKIFSTKYLFWDAVSFL